MDWSDQPAGSPAPWNPTLSEAPAAPAQASTPSSGVGRMRRLVATTALAIGLLGVGGAAVVLAADPSATPAPSAGTQADPGTTGGSGTPATPGTRPSRGPNGQAPNGQAPAPNGQAPAPNGQAPAPNGQAPNGSGHAAGDCPNMDGSGRPGRQAPSGSAAPSTNGSTSSPSTSDL